MKKVLLLLLAAGAVAVFALVRGPAPQASQASSHREAPLISDDPTADNTDLYAFRSPDKPDTVTIVSNWIPGEDPAAGSVFAGQRDDAFFGDVGAIFDLLNLRKFPPNQGGGKDFLAGYAVHAIALQLPISDLDNNGNHTIGVWATTERPQVTVKTVTKKVKVKTRVKGKLVTRTKTVKQTVVTRPSVQIS